MEDSWDGTGVTLDQALYIVILDIAAGGNASLVVDKGVVNLQVTGQNVADLLVVTQYIVHLTSYGSLELTVTSGSLFFLQWRSGVISSL